MCLCVCVYIKLKHCDIILNGWDDKACFFQCLMCFIVDTRGQIKSLVGEVGEWETVGALNQKRDVSRTKLVQQQKDCGEKQAGLENTL